tara:strand:+ start:2750 stop:4087 length:1338 start_codon:yes stop_codon:yes gene_type:complete
MINKKKLLAIHLNEFNYEFLKYGSKKYELKFLKKLISLKEIKTFTRDKTQNKDLDPWVQSVSIASGRSSKKHKIFKLGQKLPNKLINIWDVLTRKKIDCSVWGPMNSNYKKNKYMKLFFPDPWNYTAEPYPKDLQNLHRLPRYYAKNYLDIDVIKIIKYSLFFILGLLRKNIIFFTIKNFDIIFKSIFFKGLNNFVLFFLFDLISLHIFSLKSITGHKHFSFIFLNSLAHYQHNNWNEKNNEKLYFIFVDRILEYIFNIYNHHNTLMIFNGFRQKKINVEYLIRPINPENFLKKIVSFKKLEQDMTNGGFIFFKNSLETNNAYKKMKNYNVSGLYVFEINQKNKFSFYYKINLKTLKNLKEKNLNFISKKKIINCFNYEKKIKKNIKNNKININEIKDFLNDVKLIKTTGRHDYNGNIFLENFKLNKKIKTIENHKIFNLINKYY